MQRQLQHVAQGCGLHVEGELPALAVADGNPVEAHLPAVHVAVDVYRRVGQRLLHEIVARGEPHLPFFRDIDLAVHVQRVHHVVLVRFQIFAVVEDAVVVEVVVDAVGERVVEGERPGQPRLLPLRVLRLEGVLVDAVIQ